jgi:hypothetical protein
MEFGKSENWIRNWFGDLEEILEKALGHDLANASSIWLRPAFSTQTKITFFIFDSSSNEMTRRFWLLA